MRPDRSKQIVILLVSMLVMGLLAFAAISYLRWQSGVPKDNTPVLKPIAMHQAPAFVQQAAMQLAPSRVGYVIPQGEIAYVIVSAGPQGGTLELAGARRAGTMVDIDVRSGAGSPVAIGILQTPVADTRFVQFHLDGYAAGIPALVNPHNLPLVPLADKGVMATVTPREGDRVTGTVLEVSGYARIFEAQFSVQVFAAGKGRVLGEMPHVMAATGAPNWGSFRAMVPVTVPAGVTEGVVLLYDEQTDVKVVIPVIFGSK